MGKIQSTEITEGKKGKTESVEITKNSISKQTSDQGDTTFTQKTIMTETKPKQETMTVKKEVHKNLKPSTNGDCVHNVKIKDPCNQCTVNQEHKTLERSAFNVQQKENMKDSRESKKYNNDKINETESSKERTLIKPKDTSS